MKICENCKKYLAEIAALKAEIERLKETAKIAIQETGAWSRKAGILEAETERLKEFVQRHAKSSYISLEALAAELCLPKTFLRNLANKGDIPKLDVNGRLRFNPEAVQKALDELAAKGGGH